MKTRIYLVGITISIIFLTNLKGYSQNWAPVGATWYFTAENLPCSSLYIPIISYIKLESEKDTVINGWNCHKISQSSPDRNFKTYFYMYSDSNKVYEVECNQKYLLYDFNKKKGEYWIIPKYCNDTLFVDSTGIITLLNGQIRNVQYVHLINNSWGWNFTGRIIENIGFEFSLFPRILFDAIGGG